MTPLEVLEAGRDRIRDPKKWCQGSFYENGAVCAEGAIWALYPDDQGVPRTRLKHGEMAAAREMLMRISSESIPRFNDTHTHAEVLELFNLAIAGELAKQEEGCPISDTSTSSRPSLVPA